MKQKLFAVLLAITALSTTACSQSILQDQNAAAWGKTGAISGAAIKYPDIKGTITNQFEVLVTGTAPATMTITVAGCMRGGTCSSALATSSGTSNQILTPSSSNIYDYYLVTTTWTGGDSTTNFVVNRTGTVARNSGGSSLSNPVTAAQGGTGTNNSGGVNNNVGFEVYNTNSGTQSGSLGATTMVATSPASTTWYRISFYALQIAAGASCTTSTTIKGGVTFTDPTTLTSQSVSITQWSVNNNGTANTALGPPTSIGSAVFPASASTAISYSTTYTAGTGCSPGPTYQVTPILERL